MNNADKKIPDASGIVKKTDYNTKITEIESKMLSITGLAITASLTAVENKTPDVSSLINETYYDAKMSDIESKYFTIADYNKFTSPTLDAKIKQKELNDKPAIARFINIADLNMKGARSNNKASRV